MLWTEIRGVAIAMVPRPRSDSVEYLDKAREILNKMIDGVANSKEYRDELMRLMEERYEDRAY